MKSSNIGGQAVIEGVMMKNKDRYAVAVRKPDGEIEVTTDTYKSVVGKYTALTKLPFVRGIFNFVDSLVLGMKTLTWSASFYEEAFDDADDGCIFCTCDRYFYGTSVFFVRFAEEMDFFLYSSDYH